MLAGGCEHFLLQGSSEPAGPLCCDPPVSVPRRCRLPEDRAVSPGRSLPPARRRPHVAAPALGREALPAPWTYRKAPGSVGIVPLVTRM